MFEDLIASLVESFAATLAPGFCPQWSRDTSHGAFAWADATDADIASTAPNQFLIQASGWIAVNTKTDAPAGAALRVAGLIRADTVRAGAFHPAEAPLLLGTWDRQPVEFKVKRLRALRLEDNGDSTDTNTVPDGASHLIGRSPVNFVAPDVVGAVISDGATNYNGVAHSNTVWASFATIGSGLNNPVAVDALGATRFNGCNQRIGTNAYHPVIGDSLQNTIGPDATASFIVGGSPKTLARPAGAQSAVAMTSPLATTRNPFWSGAGTKIRSARTAFWSSSEADIRSAL